MKHQDDMLIYTFAQWVHTKHIRHQYRLTGGRFSVFLSIYYATKINPKPKGLKSRLMKLNPQLNQVYIEKTLSILADKGLIVYERTDNSHKYTLELTVEGIRVVDELYGVRSIGEFLDKY